MSGATGRATGFWPVALALLMFLVPTACVLGFLSATVQNERLAAKQKLVEAYRGYLPMLRDRLEKYWQMQSETLGTSAAQSPAPAAFAACILDGLADAVIILNADGKPLYPNGAQPPPAVSSDVAPPSSAVENSANSTDVSTAARALQAEARGLAQAGKIDEAVKIFAGDLGDPQYADARDSHGRLIAPDALLRALELIGDKNSPNFMPIADRLNERLNDYGDPALPSTQRRFLMKELLRLSNGAQPPSAVKDRSTRPGAAILHPQPCFIERNSFRSITGQPDRLEMNGFKSALRMLPAEELAAEYLEHEASKGTVPLLRPPAENIGIVPALQPAGLPDVWRFASPDGRAVALLRTASVLERTAALITADALPKEVCVAVVPPDGETADGAVHQLSAGTTMPGWRLTLALKDEPTGADRRIAVYVWIAALVIAAMTFLAAAAAGMLRRQLRLARLKNDLLATVSHELKTPLASIRLLIDTLLNAERLDVPRTREYLELAAKENMRLSHLIDNFLTFSRMERNKQAFEFAETSPGEIVRRAAEAVAERAAAASCRFEVQSADGLPPIMADADALVTAVLNLLDNALKYTGEDKHVVLRAYSKNGAVCFAVRDNGVGLSARAMNKVFQPFYQVDRRLSRAAGGCGLGLSIVRFIVRAHGGEVRVESRPGEGSTFTITIPREKNAEET